jgi:hypothetical protein
MSLFKLFILIYQQMKTNINSILPLHLIKSAGLLLILALLSGCTKDFEKYNTRPDALTSAQSKNSTVLQTAFGPLELGILYDNYQVCQNLSADQFSGFMMSPSFYGNNQNYVMNDGWNKNGFNGAYSNVMAPIKKFLAPALRTSFPDQYAIALLIQVATMDRVTDKFGPIPYTQVGVSNFTAAYDDQKTIYLTFFKQIDTAVANLQQYIANGKGTPLGTNDYIYGGDLTKWLKFANSLRLRLAMHIVKADPQDAQTQANAALTAAGGLMTTPADDANISGQNPNPLFQEVGWGDNRANAALVTYLVGYNDPRLPVYYTPATGSGITGQYVGLRIGANVTKTVYAPYSSLNTAQTFTQNAPYQYMSAAEVWFLRAEAALRKWSGESVQTDYETGIRTSMQQWGVTLPSTYLTDNKSTETGYTDLNGAYVDPNDVTKGRVNDSPPLSSITIAWDPNATNEQMLERIITQKWISIFPEGQEAWTEFRRTGYPKLFPVVVNLSPNGIINTQIQIRRIPYPLSEYTNNAVDVAAGVKLLGGADNGGTRLWWDVDKPNF